VPPQGLYFRKRKPHANPPDSPTKTSWFRRLPPVRRRFKLRGVGGVLGYTESGPQCRNCSTRPIGCSRELFEAIGRSTEKAGLDIPVNPNL